MENLEKYTFLMFKSSRPSKSALALAVVLSLTAPLPAKADNQVEVRDTMIIAKITNDTHTCMKNAEYLLINENHRSNRPQTLYYYTRCAATAKLQKHYQWGYQEINYYSEQSFHSQVLNAVLEISQQSPAYRRSVKRNLDISIAGTPEEEILYRMLSDGIIKVESNGNARAVSPKGAIGIMQILPTTAAEIHKTKNKSEIRACLLNPKCNQQTGENYLTRLKNSYQMPDLPAVLYAYNAGPGNAKKWLNQRSSLNPVAAIDMIKITETQNYIHRVFTQIWMQMAKNGIPSSSLTAFALQTYPRNP